MLYFTVFLLIIIIAYGVLLQSVWFPNREFSWDSVREIFIKPYFNLYGEVYADEVWRKHLLLCKLSVSDFHYLRFYGPKLWNSLPLNICCSTSVYSFKRQYKRLLIDNL